MSYLKWIVLLVLFLRIDVAHADDIKMYGNIGYEISGNYVTITVENVENSRSGGSSGDLKLKLWAVSNYYSGGDIQGYTLGVVNLGTLAGGYSYTNIVQTVSYDAPPDGTYYLVMTLTEYDGQDFILDYSQFEDLQTFDDGDTGGGSGGGSDTGGGSGSGNGGGNNSDLYFSGSVSYNIEGEFVTLSADAIYNDRDGGYSGSLTMKLWAVDTPYSGGSISGHILGEAVIGQLNGGYYFGDVSNTVNYSPPPDGTYYVVMTLTEFDGKDYVMDAINFDGTETFSTSEPPSALPPAALSPESTPDSVVEEGGGEGGAIPVSVLLLLTFALIARMRYSMRA